MFQWYKRAEICCAYLTDIDLKQGDDYLNSRWWTRAWTLQELIAPLTVDFFDMGWNYICSKAIQAAQISTRFSIDETILHEPSAIHNKSVAQRMSWAAHRRASRTEDLAYSLLGIFDINMTMQYGEGNGAFVRLQKEIIIPSSKGVATFLIASELAIKTKSMQIYIHTLARIMQNQPTEYQHILILKRRTDQISEVSFLDSDKWRITERDPGTFLCSSCSYREGPPGLLLPYPTRASGRYLFVSASIRRAADEDDLLKLTCTSDRMYDAELTSKTELLSAGHQCIDIMIPGEPVAICAKLETRFIYNQSVSTLTLYDQTYPADDGEDDDVNSACSNEVYVA